MALMKYYLHIWPLRYCIDQLRFDHFQLKKYLKNTKRLSLFAYASYQYTT